MNGSKFIRSSFHEEMNTMLRNIYIYLWHIKTIYFSNKIVYTANCIWQVLRLHSQSQFEFMIIYFFPHRDTMIPFLELHWWNWPLKKCAKNGLVSILVCIILHSARLVSILKSGFFFKKIQWSLIDKICNGW
jgi:hypothetical protein